MAAFGAVARPYQSGIGARGWAAVKDLNLNFTPLPGVRFKATC
jgi:hypothetical protein